MTQFPRRTFAIISHPDAGKTTLTEKLLLFSGAIQIAGSVKARKASRHASSDWMEIEKQRGISVASSVMQVEYRDTVINLLDTPGHQDFSEDTYRVLTAVDAAVMVIDGAKGGESQTRKLFEVCRLRDIPIVTFINKLDRTGAEFHRCVDMLVTRLQANPLVLQLPIGAEADFRGVIDLIAGKALIWPMDASKGEKYEIEDIPSTHLEVAREWRDRLVETLSEADDELMELYLEGVEPTEEQIIAGIRRATIGLKLTPVVCGTAFKNKGVQPMLDAVVRYLPSPLDIGAIEGHKVGKEGEVVKRAPSNDEPLSALAFKIMSDPHLGKLIYVRVYSGKLEAGSTVVNSVNGKKERIGKVYQMHANKREEIASVGAGQIVAVMGLKDTKTGHTLSDPQNQVILESMTFPAPVIEVAIEPKTKADQEKLGLAIQKLAEEDPTFRVEQNSDTGQTVIKGMGELHLDILVDRMKREFKVEANVGKPQVAYRETIKKAIDRHD